MRFQMPFANNRLFIINQPKDKSDVEKCPELLV